MRKPHPTESEIAKAERCTAVHAAIVGGRTDVAPYGESGERRNGVEVVWKTYRCPMCDKIIDGPKEVTS